MFLCFSILMFVEAVKIGHLEGLSHRWHFNFRRWWYDLIKCRISTANLDCTHPERSSRGYPSSDISLARNLLQWDIFIGQGWGTSSMIFTFLCSSVTSPMSSNLRQCLESFLIRAQPQSISDSWGYTDIKSELKKYFFIIWISSKNILKDLLLIINHQ